MTAKKLTDKQEKFCQEYLVDLNGTQAAIRAGYSEKTARQLATDTLSKAYIQERLAELRKDQQERTQVTADSIIERLNQIADRCMQAEPVMTYNHDEKAMVETGEYKFEHAGANKALELLGRHLGIFNDKLILDRPKVIRKDLSGSNANN